MLTPRFTVQFLEEAAAFLDHLDFKTKEKIIYNVHKSRVSQDEELFKKLKGEIWEFRTLFNSKKYRLFAFWDKTDKLDTLVIATHGLLKKTDKTPQADLDRAERIRKQYFEQKKQKK